MLFINIIFPSLFIHKHFFPNFFFQMSSFLFYRELFIPSCIEGLEECLLIVKQVGEDFNLDFDKKLALQTVTVESVENAITHGNRNIRDLTVRYNISINIKEIIIEVEDQGDGFSIDNLASPIVQDNIRKESGRGIFFIKCFSNSVCLLGKGNIIKINIER